MPIRDYSERESKTSLYARLPFYYGWVTVFVAGLTLFVSGPGQTYTVAIFVDPIIRETGWSRTEVSTLYTLGSLTAALAMIIVGRLLDLIGARVLLLVVGVLFGFIGLWMSRVDELIELYIGFAGLRILGQGSLTLIPTTLISLWFIHKRGKATAFGSLGGMISTATLPPLTHLLIANYGWRNAWIVLAGMIWGVLLIPVALLVKNTPESIGLTPISDNRNRSSNGSETVMIQQLEENWSLKEALRTSSFWLLLFAGSSQSLISTALVFHQVSLFTEKGLDSGLAAITLTVMAFAAMVGTFMAGYLTDRFPNRYVLAFSQLILVFAMLTTLFISQRWEALGFGMLLGFSGGLFMTTSTVMWANYYGRSSLGSIRGVATTAMVGFAALGPMPFGYLYDLSGDYTIAILIFLFLPLACGIAALLAFPPRKDLSI